MEVLTASLSFRVVAEHLYACFDPGVVNLCQDVTADGDLGLLQECEFIGSIDLGKVAVAVLAL